MAGGVSENGVSRGRAVVITFEGRRIDARAGETIAARLLAQGIRSFRTGADGRARGPLCGMGVCYECLVRVGRTGDADVGAGQWVRACTTPVEDGLTIERQQDPGR